MFDGFVVLQKKIQKRRRRESRVEVHGDVFHDSRTKGRFHMSKAVYTHISTMRKLYIALSADCPMHKKQLCSPSISIHAPFIPKTSLVLTGPYRDAPRTLHMHVLAYNLQRRGPTHLNQPLNTNLLNCKYISRIKLGLVSTHHPVAALFRLCGHEICEKSLSLVKLPALDGLR